MGNRTVIRPSRKRSTLPSVHGWGRGIGSLVVAILALSVGITAASAAPPAGSGGASGAPAAGGSSSGLDLGDLMNGSAGPGLGATAEVLPALNSMTVSLRTFNDSSAPVEVEVPPGTMLAPANESAQTVVVSAPLNTEGAVAAVAAGRAPKITVPPGEATFELQAFCGQKEDGSPVASPLTHIGVASAPLPRVLSNIVVQDPHYMLGQSAVWWVTDEPYLPIDDPDLLSLLDGVDLERFAGAPKQVVPDDHYTPAWMGVGNGLGNGGPRTQANVLAGIDGDPLAASGGNPLIWLLVLGIGGGLLVVALVQRSNRHVAAARLVPVPANSPGAHVRPGPSRYGPAPYGPSPYGPSPYGPSPYGPGRMHAGGAVGSSLPPGWYPDPHGSGSRFWDGNAWTDRTVRAW